MKEFRNGRAAGNFIWRVCSAHVIAYFIAGVFALFIMDYRSEFLTEPLSSLMKPVESPWIMLGPSLQIFRGMIIALVLIPVRRFIFEKDGFIKLTVLILGLSFISTIGPAPGSFDGYIYTVFPLRYHLIGIPEALLYTLLFSGIISFWYKSGKKWITIISIIFVAIIMFLSISGFFNMTEGVALNHSIHCNTVKILQAFCS